jgi:hypothetical protein
MNLSKHDIFENMGLTNLGAARDSSIGRDYESILKTKLGIVVIDDDKERARFFCVVLPCA